MEGAEGAWLRSVLPAEEEAGVVPGLSEVKKREIQRKGATKGAMQNKPKGFTFASASEEKLTCKMSAHCRSGKGRFGNA